MFLWMRAGAVIWIFLKKNAKTDFVFMLCSCCQMELAVVLLAPMFPLQGFSYITNRNKSVLFFLHATIGGYTHLECVWPHSKREFENII